MKKITPTLLAIAALLFVMAPQALASSNNLTLAYGVNPHPSGKMPKGSLVFGTGSASSTPEFTFQDGSTTINSKNTVPVFQSGQTFNVTFIAGGVTGGTVSSTTLPSKLWIGDPSHPIDGGYTFPSVSNKLNKIVIDLSTTDSSGTLEIPYDSYAVVQVYDKNNMPIVGQQRFISPESTGNGGDVTVTITGFDLTQGNSIAVALVLRATSNGGSLKGTHFTVTGY